MKAKVHFSEHAQTIIDTLQYPLDTMHRLVSRHQFDGETHHLPTPEGTFEVLISFQAVTTHEGPVTLAMVQRPSSSKFAVYTESEFKDILKESLSYRMAV